MKESSLKKMKDGIEVDDIQLYIKGSDEGRMKGHRYHHVFLRKEGIEKQLLILGFYEGKAPYYNAWMELFSIQKKIVLGDEIVKYHGSEIESVLIEDLSEDIENGENIFVEYAGDEETEYMLHRGYPVVTSRLGYLLYKNGFNWFKDWYFPEGFNEGGQKLQGEKAIDDDKRDEHESMIKKEIDGFLIKKGEYEDNRFIYNAIKRAEDII